MSVRFPLRTGDDWLRGRGTLFTEGVPGDIPARHHTLDFSRRLIFFRVFDRGVGTEGPDIVRIGTEPGGPAAGLAAFQPGGRDSGHAWLSEESQVPLLIEGTMIWSADPSRPLSCVVQGPLWRSIFGWRRGRTGMGTLGKPLRPFITRSAARPDFSRRWAGRRLHYRCTSWLPFFTSWKKKKSS